MERPKWCPFWREGPPFSISAGRSSTGFFGQKRSHRAFTAGIRLSSSRVMRWMYCRE
jgi:hypothetical protein